MYTCMHLACIKMSTIILKKRYYYNVYVKLNFCWIKISPSPLTIIIVENFFTNAVKVAISPLCNFFTNAVKVAISPLCNL